MAGDVRSGDSSESQLPASHATTEFSVLTPGHGVPHFSSRSSVCKKTPTAQSYGGIFLADIPSSQMILACV